MPAKKLVVCCDGTWNDPADRTNIHWLSRNIAEGDGQLVYYDAGVGTKWYDEKRGGALGQGLSENVRQAYHFLRENYVPGDQVYCFGFSRGAFTVRSLCGFIQRFGRLSSRRDVAEAYLFYRLTSPSDDPGFFAKLFGVAGNQPMSIRFLGVFDTVGSLGVPFEIDDDARTIEGSSFFARARSKIRSWADQAGDRLRHPITRFHDTALGSGIETACQALAIDETRGLFRPTLWTEAPGTAVAVQEDGSLQLREQVVDQVWFAGVHSDVGGGYDGEPCLAHFPLLWMAEQAELAGLTFKQGALDRLRANLDPLAPHHDPWSDFWTKSHKALGLDPISRPMSNPARLTLNPAGDLYPEIKLPERLFPSVMQRVGKDISILAESGGAKNEPYQPGNLP